MTNPSRRVQRLRYGTGSVAVELPSDRQVTVFRKPAMPLLFDPHAAVQAALDNPVGVPPILAAAQGARSACLVICDITRPVPNHLFLRPTIEALLAAGVPSSGITILVATGLHRPNLGDELRTLIGDDWVTDGFRVLNHDARDAAAHVSLGVTETRGTPIRLNRVFVEADVRIVTGLVEPHFMAGYSGGRKVVAPGVAHVDTIRTFHSARFMRDPAATSCNFVANPLHSEQIQIIERLGNVLAINTVIDEDRQLGFVNFGEVIQSHQLAVDFARQYCEVAANRKYPVVMTSAAGYPLDKTYYQTIKGMVCASGILEPGGELLIVSQCSEGFGSDEFRDAQRRLVSLGADRFLNSILAKSLADIDEWQSQKQIEPQRIGRVTLFSDGLPAADYCDTGVEVTGDLQATVDAILARTGASEIALIPEGPYVIPFVSPGLSFEDESSKSD